MDQIKRKRTIWKQRERRRAWAVLSVLWLVIVCLVGCGQSGSGQAETQTGTRMMEVQTAVQGQESGSGAGDKSGRESSAEAGGEAETGVGEEAGAAGEERINADGQGAGAASGEAVVSDQDAGSRETGAAGARQDQGNRGVNEGSTGEDSEKENETQEIQTGLSQEETAESVAEELREGTPEEPSLTVEESGSYTSREEVALYIHLYGRLPGNYITKKQAEKLGWDNKAGNLWEVAPGMSIGGSRFGNYEGALPDKKDRTYYECDIDYDGGYRGAKRIIYSNDGLIYYTEDHYKTFEELYSQ